MSGEDRRLACTHAHVNAINTLSKQDKKGCKPIYEGNGVNLLSDNSYQ